MRRILPSLLFALACSDGGTGPPPPPPAPTVSVTVSPASTESGSAVTIVIRHLRAEAGCKMDGNVVPDSFTITPTASMNGVVSCSGNGGTTTASFSIRVIPPPSLSVQAYGVNSSGEVAVTGMTAIYSSGNWKDSLALGATGSGNMEVPAPIRAQLGDSICVKLIDRRTVSTLKSSLGCMPKGPALAGEVLSFVLGPKVWSIVSGSLAGNQLPVSMVSAKTPAGDGLPFYPRWSDNDWHWQTFPIVWAVDRSQSQVSAMDSVNFSAGLSRLMDKLGPPFAVRPGTVGQDVIANIKGVRVWLDPNLVRAASAGAGGLGGIFYTGQVVFRSPESFLFTGTVEHEFIHVLGFGHTCSWFSLMPTLCPPGGSSPEPSVTDVAYIQYFYAVRGMQVNKQAKFGLEGLYRAELLDMGAGLLSKLSTPPWFTSIREPNTYLVNN